MASPQQILEAFKANNLTVEIFKAQLCDTQGVIQVISTFMTSDPQTQQVVFQFFPMFPFNLEMAFHLKAEDLLRLPGISVDAIQRILAILSHTKTVLNQVLVLQLPPVQAPAPVQQPVAPQPTSPIDQSSSSSSYDAYRNSNATSPYALKRPVSPTPFVVLHTRETLFNLKGFKVPLSHFRLFIEGIDSVEHGQIEHLIQAVPQSKKTYFYVNQKRAIFYFATNDLAQQALSAVKALFPTKNSSIKKPHQDLPLTGAGIKLFKTEKDSLKSLNDALRSHGVRISFKNDDKSKGPKGGKGQKPKGSKKGKYQFEIPEGANAEVLFDIVVDVIVNFANSRSSIASSSVETLPVSSLAPAPSLALRLERQVFISDRGLHPIMEKLLASPKIVGRLPKGVTASWDAAAKQVNLRGDNADSFVSWENEIRSWKIAKKTVSVEQNQVHKIIDQISTRCRELCVNAKDAATMRSRPRRGRGKEPKVSVPRASVSGISIKGLESKIFIIENLIQKKLTSIPVTESISLEIPIFNFVQKIFASEIRAITSTTKIKFDFEASSSPSSSSSSSSSAPPSSPSKRSSKPGEKRQKSPGASWFNQGAPGEKRTITLSGPPDKVFSARGQLQELIDSVSIEEFPPSSSSSSSSFSYDSLSPIAQRATYHQAVEILKGTKNGIHFLGDIPSASIKLVGRKDDLKGILKRIKEIARSITTSQINLSLNELKAWQDIIAADPDKLKGVCNKINSKCTATINSKKGTSLIEIAGAPDNVELAKQIINSMVGNNIASDPVPISILPEDSFLISLFFKDDLSSCLQSIPRSSVLLIPKENRIEFTCPLPEKDRAESLVRAFLANCRSQYTRIEFSLDPKLHKIILSKDQKILRKTSKKTETFIQLKQFSRLMNHADLQADPSKRIELRAGDMILDTNEAIIIPNDESLSCTSIICQAVQGKAGSTFVSDSKAAFRSGQVPRNGQCFQVQTPHSSTFDTVINLVLKNKDPKDPDPRTTLQQIIQGALQFSDQKGHQSIALPPIGPSQGYSVEDSLSALVAACSEILPSFTNLKIIKIFDMDETALTNFNQKILSLSGPQWKIATAKTISVSGLLAKQKQQMISDRLSSLNATKSSLQIWNQWYWREDSHKISPADEKIAIIEGGQYFIPYDFDQNLQIEQASQNGLSEVLVVGDKKEIKNGFSYKVDLQRRVQINSTTDFERQIIFKRLDTPLQPPAVDLVSSLSVVDLGQSVEDDEDDEVEDNSRSSSLEPVEVRIIGKDSASINAAKELIQFRAKNSISERTVKAPLPITPNQKTKIEKMLGKAISFSITSQTVTIRASKNDVDRLSLLITNYLVSKQVRKAYPPNWTSVPDPSNPFRATLVQVPAASPEFNDVQALFSQTLPSTPIIKLERIENRWLWDQYNHKAESMRLKNPHISNNEMRLFHGTSRADPSSIYNGQHGFDSNFCSSGMWGTGTYFAVNASYSKGYASNSPQGKQMFLCRVLVGDFATIPPDGGLKMPPVKASGLARFKDERYDSVSGFTGGSVVFILYHDHHAYPEYLITFA